MNAALALHTAARRYCLERYAYWCERYAEVLRDGRDRLRVGYHYSPEALATFPRYNVLNAIRVEVERIDPIRLTDPGATRELLVLAGDGAENDFTRDPTDPIAARAMAEERAAFCRYVGGLTPPDLDAIEPLPYRRVLTAGESAAIWQGLRARWQIPDGYWYPLAECRLPDVVAFAARAFEQAAPAERLHALLAARGVERVWELKEYGPEYEEDVALFEPTYAGAEGYWSSGDQDWIAYASHEGSVTVGGWLLHDLKAWCPSWEAHRWAGPFD